MAAVTAFVAQVSPAALGSASSFKGQTLPSAQPAAVAARSQKLVCRAEKSEDVAVTSRRAALSLLAGAAALSFANAEPAQAAYGEAANVFGPVKKATGFIDFTGNGFTLKVPSKWNPSREIEFPGTVARFEDNFDATNNLSVVIQPSKKGSITDYGSPEDFLNEVSYLLGRQSYNGLTASEGGFAPNVVSIASVLSADKVKQDGKDYYKISLLTRTADGDEGGKHQLITATVSDGKLYILKIQAGDKRWFKGVKKFAEGADASFSVA